ncbi:MAG TPA: TylF/MycF/NovP-related O-methyltransferase [Allosphingosinicella sp.]|jgi:hypothetical protein
MTAPPKPKNRDAYIDLIKRSITNYHYLGGNASFEQYRCVTHYDLEQARWKIDPLARPITLLSKGQLDLIEQSILALEQRRVPGDFIEAGIWRGGVIILMRAMIRAHGLKGRRLFAADSFEGIPKNVRALNDPVDLWADRWVAPLEEVRANIERFGLLDDSIVFVPGYFADTLKSLAGERFALIRLDSDSYDSVETSLDYLYPLVSKGGIVIIDDWHLPGCRMAVLNYRSQYGITDEVIEHSGNAYWIKQQSYRFPPLP